MDVHAVHICMYLHTNEIQCVVVAPRLFLMEINGQPEGCCCAVCQTAIALVVFSSVPVCMLKSGSRVAQRSDKVSASRILDRVRVGALRFESFRDRPL